MATECISDKTPRDLGYRMPAEWEEHEAVWLAWPHDTTTFPSRVDKAEEAYVQLIKHLHPSELVNLFVLDAAMQEKVTDFFLKEWMDLSRIRFFQFGYADVWFRDYGPTFLVNTNRELAMVHWMFNSWGEKYETLLKDKQIPEFINSQMRVPCFEPHIVLEGGSIDVNGSGTILTTEQCLLNKNRNPSLSKIQIETYLKNCLGASHVVWLKEGIVGDDTDGHIDDVARFVNPTTVVCAFEEDTLDENHAILKTNYDILSHSTDQDGNKLTLIKLPTPGTVGEWNMRLPASYANFYIGNQIVLVPAFGHKSDKVAQSTLQQLFPTRKVVGVDCRDIVWGLGTIHCITQQQPLSRYKA